jgi:hypothetical protein
VDSISHDQFAREQASKYRQHIRTIRFLLDHKRVSGKLDNYNSIHEDIIIDIICLCTQATSIGIYYHGPNLVPTPYRATPKFSGRLFETLTRKDREPLTSFGTYCISLWNPGSCTDPNADKNIMLLFDRIIEHPDAMQSLEHFEFIDRLLPPVPFPTLPLLTSLTLFHTWTNPADDIWTIQRLPEWVSASTITRLQLIKYSLHAEKIAECVRTCPSLQYLVVSACGDYRDLPTLRRSPGWSSQSDALCMQRNPLRSLLIECTLISWVIMALGVIPTMHLSITSTSIRELEEAFWLDGENFPHLQILSLDRRMQRGVTGGEQGSSTSTNVLDGLSKRRNFIIKYDASYLVYK